MRSEQAAERGERTAGCGDRYESTRQGWEEIWSRVDVPRELATMSYPRAQEILRAYLPLLPRDGVILEAGSGLGAVLLTLQPLGYRIHGIDYALGALRATRDYEASLPLLAGDIHQLPYATGSLAAYLSFGVLEHFEHGMAPALQEAFRVLRPGGVLVLTIPYPNWLERAVRWRKRRRGGSVLRDDEFYESAYDARQLRAEVGVVGFAIQRVLPTSHAYTFYGLGALFRAPGYYKTNGLARFCGRIARWLLPWPLNYNTLVLATKPETGAP